MSYNVTCVADFGASNSGLTLNGKLFDSAGAQTGATITSGFVELVTGLWLYTLSAPDSHSGAFVMYDSANTALRRTVAIAPRETENADIKTSTRGTSTLTTGDIDNRLAAYDGATQSDLTATQTAISNAIAALNNLSQAQAQAAVAAALSAYDPPTKAELDSAVAPLATQTSIDALAGYVDTEVAAILAAVDTEIAAIKAKTDNLPASPAATGDIPGTAVIATAIFAVAVETGHDLTTVLRAIYAAIRGRSVADDANDPTQIDYFAPDGTTLRVRHNLTDTERTVA